MKLNANTAKTVALSLLIGFNVGVLVGIVAVDKYHTQVVKTAQTQPSK